MSAAAIIEAIAGQRFLWATEDDLQRGLDAALTGAGFTVEREVRLNSADRIDLLIGRVGIEVKITGAWKNVGRQLERYLRSDQLDDLILVTCKASHRRITTDARKRLHIHLLQASGL